jgi:hypothetical protein
LFKARSISAKKDVNWLSSDPVLYRAISGANLELIALELRSAVVEAAAAEEERLLSFGGGPEPDLSQ